MTNDKAQLTNNGLPATNNPPLTTNHQLKSLVKKLKDHARELGFAFCGITTPEPPPHLAEYENWITNGMHGEMAYMATERNRQRRADLKSILPECKSIIVVALPYTSPQKDDVQNISTGRIAAYAQGADYHDIIPPKLEQLIAWLEKETNKKIAHKSYADTGAILERDLAQRAGAGWIGKNTMLINPKVGSYFLLGEVLIDLELEPDAPFTTDHCGTCKRCIDACPTDAILENRIVDARKCISYLTIEAKDSIPTELRAKINNWVFGCDVCQTVCPWNRFADSLTPDPELMPRHKSPPLIDELWLTPQEFNERFKDSPIKRSKRRGYLRNVAVALGNSNNSSVIQSLQKQANDEDEDLVREHIEWAINTLQRPTRS